MSLLFPIISLGALAGAAYFRPRRSANGHDKNPPRVPREDLPAIMAALEDPDPSAEVLMAAIREAEERGLHGAKNVFADALQRAVEREAVSRQPSAVSSDPDDGSDPTIDETIEASAQESAQESAQALADGREPTADGQSPAKSQEPRAKSRRRRVGRTKKGEAAQ